MKTICITSALLVICSFASVVASAELLDVKAGDQVIVRVDSAPIALSLGYVGYAPRDSEFEVFGTDGLSLRIRFQGWDGSIHRNYVSVQGAAEQLGDDEVSIASLMSSPIINSANPFLAPRLGDLAASLVASGREQELINIEDDLLDVAIQSRSPFGTFYQAKCYSLLGGMYRTSGDERTRIR